MHFSSQTHKKSGPKAAEYFILVYLLSNVPTLGEGGDFHHPDSYRD
jgi:hypothetical protein